MLYYSADEDKLYISSPAITTVKAGARSNGNAAASGIGLGGGWKGASNGKRGADLEMIQLTANADVSYAPSSHSGISG